jgi:hypothetical protein
VQGGDVNVACISTSNIDADPELLAYGELLQIRRIQHSLHDRQVDEGRADRYWVVCEMAIGHQRSRCIARGRPHLPTGFGFYVTLLPLAQLSECAAQQRLRKKNNLLGKDYAAFSH